MFLFVENCPQKACLHWRTGNLCVKHHAFIPQQMQWLANIHDATTCQVRKQIDVYRLTKMIEE